MTAARRLIPSSSGHGSNLVLGRERVGNEAMRVRRDTNQKKEVSGREQAGNEAAVSTWFPAADGLVTKQLVFSMTRSEFGGTAEGVMKPYDRTPRIASRLTRRSNGRALHEARPNKSLLPTGHGPTTSTPELLNRPAAE